MITPLRLAAVLGSAHTPLLLDVRGDDAWTGDTRALPGALRVPLEQAAHIARDAGREIVAYCVQGQERGRQAASALAQMDVPAYSLEGGMAAWCAAGLPTLRRRHDLGVTGTQPSVWVTRARPKIDRIACPWLVRRFIDPVARFLYVPAAEALAVAEREHGVAFDLPGAPIDHDGPLCSFDTLLAAFDLHHPVLDALAVIVRGADTGRPELAPECAGLLAVSLGLSANFEDDHAMLEQGMVMYDALYGWQCKVSRERRAWNPQS